MFDLKRIKSGFYSIPIGAAVTGIQGNTVEYSKMQRNTVHCSRIQDNAVEYSSVIEERRRIQVNTVGCITLQ